MIAREQAQHARTREKLRSAEERIRSLQTKIDPAGTDSPQKVVANSLVDSNISSARELKLMSLVRKLTFEIERRTDEAEDRKQEVEEERMKLRQVERELVEARDEISRLERENIKLSKEDASDDVHANVSDGASVRKAAPVLASKEDRVKSNAVEQARWMPLNGAMNFDISELSPIRQWREANVEWPALVEQTEPFDVDQYVRDLRERAVEFSLQDARLLASGVKDDPVVYERKKQAAALRVRKWKCT